MESSLNPVLANCLHVVRYVAVERQQLSPGYFHGCIGEVEAYMTSEYQTGKPCTGLVLLETGTGFIEPRQYGDQGT